MRAPTLFPEAPALLEALVHCGALASCWSGAGPSLLGITSEVLGGEGRLREHRMRWRIRACPGRVLLLRADRRGLVYGDEADLPGPGRSSA